jgi:hypothetical protein
MPRPFTQSVHSACVRLNSTLGAAPLAILISHCLADDAIGRCRPTIGHDVADLDLGVAHAGTVLLLSGCAAGEHYEQGGKHHEFSDEATHWIFSRDHAEAAISAVTRPTIRGSRRALDGFTRCITSL